MPPTQRSAHPPPRPDGRGGHPRPLSPEGRRPWRRALSPRTLPRPLRALPLRALLSAVLITVGCALMPLSTLSVWAEYQIADADTYVATLAPLASERTVQHDVADVVTHAIMTYVNRSEQGDGDAGDRGPLRGSVETFVNDAVRSFTGTPAFRTAWNAANRATHDAVLRDLTSGRSEVGFDLAPISAHIKQQLKKDSVPFADHFPVEHTDVTVLGPEDLAVSRKGFHLLRVVGLWLPVGTVGCAAGGILLAVRRRRAVAAAGLGTALGAAALLVALAIGRGIALGELPQDVSRASAGAVYDALTHTLLVTSWWILGTGLCVSILVWVSRRGSTEP